MQSCKVRAAATKKSAIILLILCAIVSISLAGCQPFQDQAAHLSGNRALVVVLSNPSGASLYMNGTFKGTTPRKLIVPEGAYDIQLRKNGYAAFDQQYSFARNQFYFINQTLVPATAAISPAGGAPLSQPGITNPASAAQAQKVYYAREAESGLIQAPMGVGTDPAASGEQHQYVMSASTAGEGSVSFDFAIPLLQSRAFALWARVLSPDGNHDSFYVSIDGHNETIYDAAANHWSPAWQWSIVNSRASEAAGPSATLILDLAAGTHTIRFRTREGGTKLDRIILTNDFSFTPDPSVPAAGNATNMTNATNLTNTTTTTNPGLVFIRLASAQATLQSPMTLTPDAAALSGYHLSSSSTSGAGTAAFRFTIPVTSAGTYAVWARVYSADGDHNSFYARIDNGTRYAFDTAIAGADFGHWTWTLLNARADSASDATDHVWRPTLSAGAHTLTFQAREAGTQLDSLIITNDLSYAPNGSTNTTTNTTILPPNPPPVPAIDTILEAENAIRAGGMTVSTDTTDPAHPITYITTPSGQYGSITFTTSLPSGSYALWARTLAADGDTDSFYVQYDNSPNRVFDVAQNGVYNKYQWVRLNGRDDSGANIENPRNLSLGSSGAHTIIFSTRESRTRLDKILITNNLSYVPAEGPSASDSNTTPPNPPNPLPACTPNSYSGCLKCLADGSGYVPDNSACGAGMTCNAQSGSCVDNTLPPIVPSPGCTFSVKDYGSKGDGATDDTQAIRTALSHAKSGDVVCVPSGKYRVTGIVTMPDGVTLQGDGMGSSWIAGRIDFGSNQAYRDLKIGDRGDVAVHNLNGASHTIFERVHFRGGAGTGLRPVIMLGDYRNSDTSYITFRNCEVERNLGKENENSSNEYNNIRITSSPSHTHVAHITFDSCHIGVSNGQGGHDIGSPRAGIEVWTDPAGVADCVGTYGADRTRCAGWEDINLLNSVWEATDEFTIDLADWPLSTNPWGAAGGIRPSGPARVVGNVIKGGGYPSQDHAPHWTGAVDIELPHDVLVENNTIYRSSKGTVIFSHYGDPDASHIGAIVRNNYIDATVDNGINILGGCLICFGPNYNGQFYGNTIKIDNTNYDSSRQTNGIRILMSLENTAGNTITGNTVTDIARVHNAYAFQLINADNNVITGNTFTTYGMSSAGVDVQSSSTGNSNILGQNTFIHS